MTVFLRQVVFVILWPIWAALCLSSMWLIEGLQWAMENCNHEWNPWMNILDAKKGRSKYAP